MRKNSKKTPQWVHSSKKIPTNIESKGKGKSGGLRIVTYHVEVLSEELCRIFLASIYDKSDLENLPDHIIDDLVQDIQDELAEE